MIPITAPALSALTLCERRAWLDTHAEQPDDGPLTLSVEWAGRGPAMLEEHRAADWAGAVEQTRRWMRQGAACIYGACFELHVPLDLSDRVYTIRARIDRLMRVEHVGRVCYAPVLLREPMAADEADRGVLDLWVWILAALDGSPPPAETWLGVDALGRARRRLPHDYDETRVLDALTRAADVLNRPDAPAVRLIEACKTCPHQIACHAIAREDGALELLYGVSRRVREGLRAAGFCSLAEVAAARVDELQMVKGIGPATAPVIHANARAWLMGRPVRLRPAPDVCCSGGWMFDLETLERRGQIVPWCMGWCDVSGRAQIALIGPVQTPEVLALPGGQQVTLAPDSDGLWEIFAAAVDDGRPIFHWSGYDAAILRATAPLAIQVVLGPRLQDLHRHFTRSISLPLRSTSIKAVSTYLGYPWPGYNEWFAAYLDYRYWLDSGAIDALERACLYQRADVESMAWVWRWWMATDGAPDLNPGA